MTDAIGDNLGVATDVDVDVVAAADSSVRDVVTSDVGESTFTFLSIPFSPPLTFSTGVIWMVGDWTGDFPESKS